MSSMRFVALAGWRRAVLLALLPVLLLLVAACGADSASGSSGGNGSCRRPNDGPAWGKFGDSRDGGTRNHLGVDIGGKMHSPIYAIRDGKVAFAGKVDNGYGAVVKIDHNGKIQSRSAHVQTWSVKAGDKVKKGQVIATVGDRGKSGDPHLHFEIVDDGKHIDPEKWMRKNCNIKLKGR